MKVTILSQTNNPISVIEKAARTCYDSRDKINPEKSIAFIKGLIKRGHEGPLEHASITFDIEGVSRALLAQLTRHRLASFCVKSQRYCKVTGRDFIIPETIKNTPEAFYTYDNALSVIQACYREMLALGIPTEDARFILPNATTTDITMTVNFREIRHILQLRLNKHAQWEIQNLCKEITKLLYAIGCSWLYEDLIDS